MIYNMNILSLQGNISFFKAGDLYGRVLNWIRFDSGQETEVKKPSVQEGGVDHQVMPGMKSKWG